MIFFTHHPFPILFPPSATAVAAPTAAVAAVVTIAIIATANYLSLFLSCHLCPPPILA
jgi:hypothetical protein